MPKFGKSAKFVDAEGVRKKYWSVVRVIDCEQLRFLCTVVRVVGGEWVRCLFPMWLACTRGSVTYPALICKIDCSGLGLRRQTI